MNPGPGAYLLQRRHEEPWTGNGDPLREVRGILCGLLLVAPFWAAIGLVIWWWLA